MMACQVPQQMEPQQQVSTSSTRRDQGNINQVHLQPTALSTQPVQSLTPNASGRALVSMQEVRVARRC